MKAPQPTDINKTGHRRWVKITHWIGTISFLFLVFSGVEILMVHPRFYWGETGNDLMPALFELPIGRNYQHGGWTTTQPFFTGTGSAVSASRTYDIFNQNTGFTTTQSGSYITQTQSNRLGRYFLLSFTLRLQKFAGQRPSGPPEGGPRGPGGFGGGPGAGPGGMMN